MTTPLFLSESVPIEVRNILAALKPGMPARYEDFEGHIRFVSDDYITLCIRKYPHGDPNAKNPNTEVCLVITPDKWDDLEIDDSVFQHVKNYHGKTDDHPGNDLLPPVDNR